MNEYNDEGEEGEAREYGPTRAEEAEADRRARLDLLRQVRNLHETTKLLFGFVGEHVVNQPGPLSNAYATARMRLAAFREAVEHLTAEARKP